MRTTMYTYGCCWVLAILWSTGGVSGEPCGGSINTTAKTSDSIFFLNVTENCTYTFSLNGMTDLYLMLEQLILPKGASLGFYQSNMTILEVDSTIDDIKVVYSRAKTTSVVFKAGPNCAPLCSITLDLTYSIETNGCNITIAGSDGRFSSPTYLPTSNGKAKCTYMINKEKESDSIGLSFESVDIKKGTLTILNEGNYTDGTTHAKDEILSSATVTIELSTNETQGGFNASFVAVNSDCSKPVHVKLGEPLILKSPNFPKNYANNLDCRTIVTADDDMVLKLELSSQVFADQYDHLIINDGDSRTSPALLMLNQGSPKIEYFLLTSGKSLWVHFGTDETLTAKGFSMTITPQVFGQALKNSGHLELKAHPNDTRKDPNATDVYFQLRTDADNQITVNLNSNSNSSLLYPTDSISFYEGLAAVDPPIAVFRTVTPFYPVFSQGNAMLIVAKGFLVNGSLGQNYFSGDFTSAKASTENKVSVGKDDTYSLVSSINATYPKEAVWLIPNTANDTVVLTLSTVSLGPDSVLTIHRGLSDSSNVLAEIKSSTKDLPVIYIQDGVRVAYSTDKNSTANVTTDPLLVQGAYRTIQGCGGPVTQGSEQNQLSVSSPSFPDRYPYNADCIWNYTIPANKSVHVSFAATFDLAKHHTVSIGAEVEMKLEEEMVGNGTIKNKTMVSYGQYGGSTVPNDVLVTGEDLIMKFSSLNEGEKDNWDVSKGFMANLRVLDYGVNLTAAKGSGSIASPPVTSSESLCVWILSVPHSGSTNGSVNIIQFDITVKGYTDQSFSLTLKDGASMHDENLPFTNGTQKKILTRTNSLYVEYHKPAGEANTDFGFNISYSLYDCPASQLCKNGLCMHLDWKCNDIDDCGDGSDEADCTCVEGKHGYKPWVVAIVMVIGILCGVILAFAVPACYRKLKNRHSGGGTGYGNLDEEPVI